jgi:hypothetical protein
LSARSACPRRGSAGPMRLASGRRSVSGPRRAPPPSTPLARPLGQHRCQQLVLLSASSSASRIWRNSWSGGRDCVSTARRQTPRHGFLNMDFGVLSALLAQTRHPQSVLHAQRSRFTLLVWLSCLSVRVPVRRSAMSDKRRGCAKPVRMMAETLLQSQRRGAVLDRC